MTQRNPLFDETFYASANGLEDFERLDLYQHYVHVGRFNGHDPNEYFDTSWYLDRNRDVAALRLDPLDHYLERGAAEGRDPSPAFSTCLYRMLYPDVAASGINPLLHFLRHGRQEGRIAPPVALLPALATMADPAAAAAIDPRTIASAKPVIAALSRWTAQLSRLDGPPSEAEWRDWTRDRWADLAGSAPLRQSRPAPKPGGPGRSAPAADARPAPPVRRGARRLERSGAEAVVARRSPWRVRLFAAFFARDLAASFHAIRLLGRLPAPVAGPLVLFTNHPSWWDAELYHWLAAEGFPTRRGFAPMDAAHLDRHRLLTRLGAFAVRPGTFRGAAAFLGTAERILQASDSLLIVAVEGRYRDVRDGPVRPMPGIAHLARRVPEATFVPLAIDYVFWGERRPNLLLRFGAPIPAAALTGGTAAVTARLAAALDAALAALAEAGRSRQPQRFQTLLEGREGVGALYDLWQRLARRLPRRAGTTAGRVLDTSS